MFLDHVHVLFYLVAAERILPYLDSWEESVDSRPEFDPSQKKRMLLSTETLLGIRQTGIINYYVNFFLPLSKWSQFFI